MRRQIRHGQALRALPAVAALTASLSHADRKLAKAIGRHPTALASGGAFALGLASALLNIHDESELVVAATHKKFLSVCGELDLYNLVMIISVGYRVKSTVSTRFRIWATQRLKEYIVTGFTMDDERLKEGGHRRYFEELLARIRDIRSSEKVFWRKGSIYMPSASAMIRVPKVPSSFSAGVEQ